MREDGTAMASGLEIGPETRAKLAEATRSHGIRLLLAFGSRRSDSWALVAELQQLFPAQEVDLVWLHRADPLLAWHVCRNARLLFGDARDFEERRAYAWRRFVEYDRFFELERQAVRARIAPLRHAG